MCFLAGVSRAGFYRYLRVQDPWQEEMAVRSEVQRIALDHHGGSYPRPADRLRRAAPARTTVACIRGINAPRARGPRTGIMLRAVRVTAPQYVCLRNRVCHEAYLQQVRILGI